MTTAAAQRKCSSRVACRSLCYRTPDPSDPPLPLAASLLRTLLLLSAGPLPSSWSALSKLQGLDLSHNALDSTLPGGVRERLIVAHYRHKGEGAAPPTDPSCGPGDS